jgi:hypothetical protein
MGSCDPLFHAYIVEVCLGVAIEGPFSDSRPEDIERDVAALPKACGPACVSLCDLIISAGTEPTEDNEKDSQEQNEPLLEFQLKSPFDLKGSPRFIKAFPIAS